MPVRAVGLVVLAVIWCSSPVRADTPDEKTCHKAGVADRPPLDVIIAACTRAIGRAKRDDQDLWYLLRSKAHSLKGDFKSAFADVERSIVLYGTSRNIGIQGRGDIRYRNKDLAGAIADYELVLRTDSGDGPAGLKRNHVWAVQSKFDQVVTGTGQYLAQSNLVYAKYFLIQRGLAFSYLGEPAKGLADFKKSIELDVTAWSAIDAVFWHDIIARGNGLPGLAQHIKDGVLQRNQIFIETGLLLGRATVSEIEATIADAGRKKSPGERKSYSCRAHYYSGLWALLEQKREEAIRWLQRAVADCDSDPDADYLRNWRVWAPPLELKRLLNPQAPPQGAPLQPTTSESPASPAGPAADHATGTTSSETDDASRSDYDRAERIGGEAAWKAFLNKNPNGYYAELARAQLAKLGGPATAPQQGGPAPPAERAPETAR